MKKECLTVLSLVAVTGFVPQCHAGLELGLGPGFAVIGNTTVTSSGDTVLNGSLGAWSGTVVQGFGPGNINGTTYMGGLLAQQAAAAALATYTALGGETPNQNLSGQDLGGLSLTPGVYQFTSAAQLTGQLTLNAQNNPNAVFVFQVGGSLTTADLASMVLENGARADNIFWEVGSSAVLGSGSIMYGNVLADNNLTMGTGASLDGDAVALQGGVFLDDNNIGLDSIPETNPIWSLALCGAAVGISPFLGRWRGKLRGFLKSGWHFGRPA